MFFSSRKTVSRSAGQPEQFPSLVYERANYAVDIRPIRYAPAPIVSGEEESPTKPTTPILEAWWLKKQNVKHDEIPIPQFGIPLSSPPDVCGTPGSLLLVDMQSQYNGRSDCHCLTIITDLNTTSSKQWTLWPGMHILSNSNT